MPPLRLRFGGTDTVVGIWSSCWSSGSSGSCGDGQPPDIPVDIGAPAQVEVLFDTPGWRFSATAVPTGAGCGGREESVDLPATGPVTHRLVPIGAPGDYTITLRGRSNPGAPSPGDLAATFRWHTGTGGPHQAPSATVSIVADLGAEGPGMPGELAAHALGVSTRPDNVRASVVITSGTGDSMTVQFHPLPDLACVPQGSLFYRTDNEVGARLASLGPPPFRYVVTLVLGSTPYRGTGTWPDDVMSACSPCTRLQFDPPLPAL
jgi:hypothetical protein